MDVVPSVLPGLPRFISREVHEREELPILRRIQAANAASARLLDEPRRGAAEARPSDDLTAGW